MAPPSPLPTVRTADDLLALPDDGFRYELVRGELRRSMPAGHWHGVVAMNIGGPLRQFARAHDLGQVSSAEPGFRLGDRDLRVPDIGFVRKESVVAAGKTRAFWRGAPDLAVEVVSPNDRWTEVEEKVFDWLDAGTRMVVVADERRRTVTVFRSRIDVVVLTEDDVLDGGDVVPGWRLPVAEIFAE